MTYFDIYKKRANRYGLDYKTRVQSERERLFDLYLLKTLYRVDFQYQNETIEGSLEKYKQDETKTLQYLLTKVSVNIPNGTILMIPDKDMIERPWMVYYLEDIKTSGYNRYVVLKMTHFISWVGRDGQEHSSWAYMYGQEDNMLKDEIRSRSRMDTIYAENLKLNFFILPLNEYINKNDYLIIGEKPIQEYYVVTGYDRQSTLGVEYVSVDPTYEYDLTPSPERPEGDTSDDYYWLEGGIK